MYSLFVCHSSSSSLHFLSHVLSHPTLPCLPPSLPPSLPLFLSSLPPSLLIENHAIQVIKVMIMSYQRAPVYSRLRWWELSGVYYRPRTRETKSTYEILLSFIQKMIGDQVLIHTSKAQYNKLHLYFWSVICGFVWLL